MAPRLQDTDTSMETILNYDNRDAQSQWSTVWSTNIIPGMDNATGTNRFRSIGRRRLRVGSLALSALLTMHSRVPASALTDGFVFFMVALWAAVIIVASPLRHFEVYLGQWSINGPGRAFRIIPLLDGIGIAMCFNAIFRAINYCTVAAIAALYTLNSLRDGKLPFTYCRDFDLNPYVPEHKELRYISVHGIRILMETEGHITNSSTLELVHRVWDNASESNVEVVKLRPDLSMIHFNIPLVVLVLCVWTIIWCTMLSERILYSRLIWNNLPQWIIIIPFLWTTLIMFIGAYNISAFKTIQKAFRFGKQETLVGLANAIEVSLYIHAASVGTELITGKGLNRYAAGHIDPTFNQENLCHSFFVVLLSGFHSGAAALCAAVDIRHPNWTRIDTMSQSSLWIFPVYSKCTSLGDYSHFMSAAVFSGLTLSYLTVAYVFMKTALHTIFEYKVKLVFKEQLVVAALLLCCALLNLLFVTHGGLALLEAVEALMTGVTMPLICLLEMVSLLYVYRSHDFTSDVNIAMEESVCSARVAMQWQIIPFIMLATLICKCVFLFDTEIPKKSMMLATVPLVCVVLALPLRAAHNAYMYLHPQAARD